MQTIENKIINRVYGHGRGWAFFKNDFSDIGNEAAIDQALSRLAKRGTIRRVIRGIYDYPKFSKLLTQDLPSDIDQVAQALARKFGWRIQVSENAALNILGLSTQVPGRYMYLSDGKSCSYEVGKQTLYFKKTLIKDVGLKYPESALVVQAIKGLNTKRLNDQQREQIRRYFDEKVGAQILKDTRYTTSWVYDEIKRIFNRVGD
ncbi:MAG: hypothetical protein HQM07_07435 [Zetaproteobacteria bacterium]|nr:hypothetical protein [Zetaproteobacteria bacterium]